MGRFKLLHASQATYGNIFGAMLATETDFQHALTDPSYWSLVASMLHVGDKIIVHDDPMTFEAELCVRALSGVGGVHNTRASVELLRNVIFSNAAPAAAHEPKIFEVKWKGPHLRWAVVRVSDEKVMSENHETREHAAAQLGHLLRLNSPPA
jgi:hypothetical protein